jgi:hypothetical protein
MPYRINKKRKRAFSMRALSLKPTAACSLCIRLKIRELRKPSSLRSSAGFTGGLELDDVLSLQAFLTLDYLKLHFLVFRQGFEAFSDDGRMMHEDIGAVFTGDKAIALGVIKPLNLACFLHEPSDPPNNVTTFSSAKNEAGEAVRGKTAEEARSQRFHRSAVLLVSFSI